MRRIRLDVKMILSSGYRGQDAMGRFAVDGLAGFLQKPYRSRALQDPVDETLRTDEREA
jgi:FixJ family two-component response regulator